MEPKSMKSEHLVSPPTPGPVYVIYRDGRREGVEIAYHRWRRTPDGDFHIWRVTSRHNLQDVDTFEIELLPPQTMIEIPIDDTPPSEI